MAYCFFVLYTFASNVTKRGYSGYMFAVQPLSPNEPKPILPRARRIKASLGEPLAAEIHMKARTAWTKKFGLR